MNHKDEKQIIAKHIHGIVGGKPQFVHYNDKKNLGYMSVAFHTKMAKTNHLYKLTEGGLIVGGAITFPDGKKLNIGRIFVCPEHHRKGLGLFMMQEIEAMYPEVKEIYLDTPIWNVRTNQFYNKLGYLEYKRDDEFVYYVKRI